MESSLSDGGNPPPGSTPVEGPMGILKTDSGAILGSPVIRNSSFQQRTFVVAHRRRDANTSETTATTSDAPSQVFDIVDNITVDGSQITEEWNTLGDGNLASALSASITPLASEESSSAKHVTLFGMQGGGTFSKHHLDNAAEPTVEIHGGLASLTTVKAVQDIDARVYGSDAADGSRFAKHTHRLEDPGTSDVRVIPLLSPHGNTLEGTISLSHRIDPLNLVSVDQEEAGPECGTCQAEAQRDAEATRSLCFGWDYELRRWWLPTVSTITLLGYFDSPSFEKRLGTAHTKYVYQCFITAMKIWIGQYPGIGINLGETKNEALAVFRVSYSSRVIPRRFAIAFCPSKNTTDRTIYIHDLAFHGKPYEYLTSIICHELGHVLGARHDFRERDPSVRFSPANGLSIMGKPNWNNDESLRNWVVKEQDREDVRMLQRLVQQMLEVEGVTFVRTDVFPSIMEPGDGQVYPTDDGSGVSVNEDACCCIL